MKNIKTIEIEYHEQDDSYRFVCPYCQNTYVLPEFTSCKHLWFAYESINAQPLFISDDLQNAISEKLEDHYTKGPESFRTLWMEEYRPDGEDPAYFREEYDAARYDCIQYYLESSITLDDVLWFLKKLPAFADFNDHATLAVLPDGEGNATTYLLVDDHYAV